MESSRYAVFGQELYFEDSIKAIESISEADADGALVRKIADLLCQPSAATRVRIASKIAQRYFRPKEQSKPFLGLVRVLRSETARRDLLYWRTARTDTAIAAIADELFYPYFVQGVLPAGYDEVSFRMANTAALFEFDNVITSDFAVSYAKSAWNFDCAKVVTLSLRILKQAGILDSLTVKVGRRHVLGYFPRPHAIRPEVFAYCLAEELLKHDSAAGYSMDRVEASQCAKLFLLSRLQVASLFKELERKHVMEYVSQHGGRYVRFTTTDLSALADSLSKR